MPADAVARRRLRAWFDAHAEKRLRFVAASPGTGKTIALGDLLRSAHAENKPFAYIRFRPKKTAQALRSCITDALGLPETAGADGNALFHALEALPQTTIALDNADAATEEALEELNALVLDAPENIWFVVAARSRSIIRDARLFVEGTAARLPAELLDLTIGEAAELCDAYHLAYTENDLNKLVHQTEGWAIVTAACIREAALAKRTAADAFSGWMREHRTAFIEYVRQEAARSGNSAILERAVSSLTVGNLSDLEKLEHEGMFVRFDKGHYSLMRLVRQLFSFDFSQTSAPARQFVLMKINVLGEFEAWIGDRKIAWIRRRDAQIFKYVLLKPDGRATRHELLEAFWPGRERQLGLQALRTSCSNIRQVLRDTVGPANVANYFQAEGDVVVPPGCSLVDLHRFTSFVSTAESVLVNGDIQSAIKNFEAALSLYRGPLIVDVPAAHYEHLAKNAEMMFENISTHLRGLRRYPKQQEPEELTNVNVLPLKRKQAAKN